MIDHGGNLDVARARFGGELADWIDLSTGINRLPYPIPELSPHLWNALPSRAQIESLHEAARQAYDTTAPVVAMAGAQAAIQLLPRLGPPGCAKILSPTYGEFGHVLRMAGWEVEGVSDLEALAGADLAIVVNPNNPDGRRHDPGTLLALAPRVGRLVVDESFVDVMPQLSLAPRAGRRGLLVLRSFGKFYGLAGLRLGFALGCEADIATLAAMSGPWPVSGVAIEIGQRALLERQWADATCARLVRDAARLDELARGAGWALLGGTPLFRLYETGDGLLAQERLARARIWSRVFKDRPSWLRLGLPGDEAEWQRLSAALAR
ncbi:threonine-phosphate decarboxylase CobD [Bradyrhizobium sp. ARR65]|uniref:threonine-phosphate decarboxylase CobD n=1 Tax=Bradyrhizobium sp. ARR65 TaxID=1040989 RepID=UPI0004639593|nr:threonine-phosphate decarboxylase CobD [Bradyrhizobium sp. ARR65]